MDKILFINSCIREKNSRTLELAQFFFHTLKEKHEQLEITERNLIQMDLKPLMGDYFWEREELLQQGNRDHERFELAHEFAAAKKIVIAAPFWDLSIPALLKIYIENISVEGITFGCNVNGMYGMCNAYHLLFITTRGDFYGEGPFEMGSKYLESLCNMFGIKKYDCIYAEGIDAVPKNKEQTMNEAKEKLEIFAKSFV